MSVKGCNCGAFNATDAGLRQMSPQDRRLFWSSVRKCKTCKRDRQAMDRHAAGRS